MVAWMRENAGTQKSLAPVCKYLHYISLYHGSGDDNEEHLYQCYEKLKL